MVDLVVENRNRVIEISLHLLVIQNDRLPVKIEVPLIFREII